VKRVPVPAHDDVDDDSFVEADADARRDLQRLREIERRLQSFNTGRVAGLSDDDDDDGDDEPVSARGLVRLASPFRAPVR
jgi:hypothetical protein